MIGEDGITPPVLFDGLTMLGSDELLAWIEIAPNHEDTRSATILPNRRLTDSELEAWIEEYRELGGINAFELEVIRLINEIRVEYGLSPWVISMELSMAARFHSQEMADLNYFSHTSPVYGSPSGRAEIFGHRNTRGDWQTLENIGRNSTPERLVNAWMNSPSHRAALLGSNFVSVGIGRSGSGTVAKFSV
jgi:uncharacterized protein YkwD